MPVYVVTGNLGGGKSLMSVSRMKRALISGRRIATNLDIFPEFMFPHDTKKGEIIRLPDKPTHHDLRMLGKGSTSKDEKTFGEIYLDECGTWFNSRTWGDKERSPLIDWLLHSRKNRWNIYFLIQDIGIIDKQVRLTMAEHTVYCRRLDRLNIPLIGPLFNFLMGDRIPLPRLHVGIVRYGNNDRAIIVDRWFLRGSDLFRAYDTEQEYTDTYKTPTFINSFGVESGGNDIGPFTYLQPWHLRGWRSVNLKTGKNFMRITKIHLKRLRSPLAFLLGAILVFSYHLYSQPTSLIQTNTLDPIQFKEAKILNYSSLPGRGLSVTLKHGEKIITSDELLNKGFKLSGNGQGLIISGGGKDVKIYR